MINKLKINKSQGLIFVLPAVIVLGILVLYPIVNVIYLSITNSETGSGIQIVGLNNFIDVFNSFQFTKTIVNTIIWLVATVILAFGLGLWGALLINQDFIKGKTVWRSLLLLAWITPAVVKAVAWKWLYSYDYGMINYLLLKVHLINEPIGWLSNPSITLWSVIIVQVWATFPFAMLLISAGLQSISKDFYEVAQLEGARWYYRIFKITLPMIKDVVFITVLMLVIWSLNEFTIIWIITQGGPAGSSQILSLSIYDQFQSFDLNGAAATAVIQLVFSLTFAIWYIKKSIGGEQDG